MSTTTVVYDTGYYFKSQKQVSGPSAEGWNYSYTPSESPVPCFRSRTGSPVYDYKRKIARGENATSVFHASEQSYSSIPAVELVFGSTVTDPSNKTAWRKARADWSHGIFAVYPVPSEADLAEATLLAQTRFYKALEKNMTLFQGGVFLAELRETLAMIRNPAKALRKRVGDYLGALKKGRRGTPSQKRRFLADTYLEHSFGWAPLLNDLDDARHFLDRRQEQLYQELIKISGLGTVERTVFSFDSYGVGASNLTCSRLTTRRSLKVYAGAVSSKAAGRTLLSSSALGLSSRSFVPTLWEVLPWSFAIDYFSNIGDVLTAWSNQTVGLAWGRETTVRETRVESFGTEASPPDSGLRIVFERSVSPGKTIAVNKSVERRPISYVPLPALNFELPGFGTKWLNLAALADARRRLSPF